MKWKNVLRTLAFLVVTLAQLYRDLKKLKPQL